MGYDRSSPQGPTWVLLQGKPLSPGGWGAVRPHRSTGTVAPDLSGLPVPQQQTAAAVDSRAGVGTITAPCRLICGDLDHAGSPEVMTSRAADLPDSELQIGDGWSHTSLRVHRKTETSDRRIAQ